MQDLHTATRAKLLSLVHALVAQVEALQAQVAAQAEEIARLRKGGGGKGVPAWVKPRELAGRLSPEGGRIP